MTNRKNIFKPVAIGCCLLILAFGSFQTQELQAAKLSPNAAPVGSGSRSWTNGVVPFEFDSNVVTDDQIKMIDAMAVLEGVANVDFRQCDSNNCQGGAYVHIQDSDENAVFLGMGGGGQQTFKTFQWDSKFELVSLLMICLGFAPEDLRSDRDDYIWIDCNNVKGGCSDSGVNFKGYGRYDFDSVMHPGQCSRSKNNICPTPTAEFPDGGVTYVVAPPNGPEWQNKIGQRDHLSEMDRVTLSFVYPPPDWRFFDGAYIGHTSNGSFFKPYTNFAEAVANTPGGGTLWILSTQTIPAMGTYGKNITIKAAPDVEATLGD